MFCIFDGHFFIRSDADEILLKNGDRVSGKIVTMTDEKIVMNTTYGQEMWIAWAEISQIKGDETINSVLADGTSIKGYTVTTKPGLSYINEDFISAPDESYPAGR